MLSKSIREKFLKFYPDADLRRWLDPLEFNCGEDLEPDAGMPENIQVVFPHNLFAEWFNSNFKKDFEDGLNKIYPDNKPNVTYSAKYGASGNNLLYAGQSSHAPHFVSERRKIGSVAGHNEENLFQSFLFNKKNIFPVEAALNFAQGGGQGVFIIYGATGMGKSHLLGAINQTLQSKINKKDILFSKLHEIESFYSKTFKNYDSPLSYLGSFKYVLVDDVDECADNKNIQRLLSKFIEVAQNNGIRCAFTIKSRPADCAFFDEKFRSLLESGLVLELKKPDLDIKRQYANQCAQNNGVVLSKEEALTLARMFSEFRQIHGAMLKLSEYTSLSGGKKLPLDEILKNSKSSSALKLTPDQIIFKVAEYFNLEPEQITGKNRRQDVVTARHLAMYLCRDLLEAQLGTIGEIFSGRDHSSVIYSVNKIKKLMPSNKDMNIMVTEVKNSCLK